jgi:Transposase DDE domain
MMKQQQLPELDASVLSLIESYFPCLRRTVRRNLSRLTCAFLRLAWSVRFGYGGLHLTSIARSLSESKNFKSSYKWLSRFLKCKYFDPSSLAESMLALMLGQNPPPWVIVLIDQTTLQGVQVVNAAIPFQGRALPVAWVDFEYPWKALHPPSQNTIERYLLTWLGESAPKQTRLILIFDRGYARVALIKDLNHGRHPFLIRAPNKVLVQAQVRGRRQRLSLGRLPQRCGRTIRYRQVLYHSEEAEPVDLVVYRERGFEQAWFLVVPPDSESWLPTEDVVRLYRQRMQIACARSPHAQRTNAERAGRFGDGSPWAEWSPDDHCPGARLLRAGSGIELCEWSVQGRGRRVSGERDRAD